MKGVQMQLIHRNIILVDVIVSNIQLVVSEGPPMDLKSKCLSLFSQPRGFSSINVPHISDVKANAFSISSNLIKRRGEVVGSIGELTVREVSYLVPELNCWTVKRVQHYWQFSSGRCHVGETPVCQHV